MSCGRATSFDKSRHRRGSDIPRGSSRRDAASSRRDVPRGRSASRPRRRRDPIRIERSSGRPTDWSGARVGRDGRLADPRAGRSRRARHGHSHRQAGVVLRGRRHRAAPRHARHHRRRHEQRKPARGRGLPRHPAETRRGPGVLRPRRRIHGGRLRALARRPVVRAENQTGSPRDRRAWPFRDPHSQRLFSHAAVRGATAASRGPRRRPENFLRAGRGAVRGLRELQGHAFIGKVRSPRGHPADGSRRRETRRFGRTAPGARATGTAIGTGASTTTSRAPGA